MTLSKTLGLIGLCAKANKLASGEYQVDEAIKSGKAWLVIVAGDASENTKKHYRDSCEFYEIPFYIYKDKEQLSNACGKANRVSLAITDEGFAKGISDKIREEING